MSETRSEQITRLLERPQASDEHMAKDLMPLVYDELRAYAGKIIDWERPGHTLQRTALVHEAYVRLVRTGANYRSRLHFLFAAAQAMRRVLVDHALARRSQKRGGDVGKISLADVDAPDPRLSAQAQVDVLALNEALDRLAKKSARQAQVVMLRFFAGREEAEIGEMLQVSEKTVRRDWQTARLWLFRQLAQSEEDARVR
jgi:RNA polymerase sigma factor (TIGR02999 family)